MKRPLNEIETFRAHELLLQRATEGLDEREAAELAALGADEDLSFDLAAAAIDIATIRGEEMPIGVADKVLIAAGIEGAKTTVMDAVMAPSETIPPDGMPPIGTATLAGFMPPRPIHTTTPPPVQPAPQSAELPVVVELPTGMRPVVTADPPRSAELPIALRAGADSVRTTYVDSPHEPRVRFDAPLSAVQPAVATPAAPATVIPIDAKKKKSRAPLYAGILAAASLAFAIGTVIWAMQRAPGETPIAKTEPTAAEARTALLASANDAVTLPWAATKDPNALAASGDVVWSATAQRGFMRFKGLTPNDVKAIQYQLWIFDKDRDQAFPVDGGVFDVSSTGEIIVPITAKLHVDNPVLFAVTIERPGGVVVSKRERIVVTAAPKA